MHNGVDTTKKLKYVRRMKHINLISNPLREEIPAFMIANRNHTAKGAPEWVHTVLGLQLPSKKHPVRRICEVAVAGVVDSADRPGAALCGPRLAQLQHQLPHQVVQADTHVLVASIHHDDVICLGLDASSSSCFRSAALPRCRNALAASSTRPATAAAAPRGASRRFLQKVLCDFHASFWHPPEQ